MFDQDCIFCKIIQKQISTKIIKENDFVLVIEDINPKAPIHYLILPKKHIININFLTDQDQKYYWEMIKITREIAKDIQEKDNLKDPISFNLISNNGVDAGQSVFHLHLHFLSGNNIYSSGFQL